ncbi:hypothetical protein CEY16_08890 [Halalkalibacillus sediminis]|uniref:Uncharacterized protein n=1 Tax=Halalkalibacillus sediminis TaxID=2018042 RepID=A0A2I0QUM0_9BACI|nr:hypothetical protein [Halalkalibacillus sediminis]PKR78026.1 hypothetical protein CEY16_08890 [Halalkalibacillus sediminis]
MGYILLIINTIIIIFSYWFVTGGYDYLWDFNSTLEEIMLAIIFLAVIYLVFWGMVGVIKKRAPHLFKNTLVWLAVTPNIIVAILLFVNAYYTSLGVYSAFLGLTVLVSVVVIPTLINKI